MKILYKTMGLGLLSACLCLLCAAPASAKVCFVGEENCTGGGSFENYKDPSKDGSLCTQEGYTSKTSCQADMTKYIAGYCPYNNNYVMCCGREYSYDACVYPLVADGKCGNRFKCRCDSDKYPYKQQSATVCKNTVTGQNYDNSIASGASCVYTGFANGQTSINAYFTECLCDRGLYPKTEEECSKDGSSVSNKSCVDSNGNTYYTACICGDEFKVIASECKYGININEPMCQQGDVLKAKKCCDCNINTYPYGDIEDVEGSSSPVASYASCEKEKGCTRGSRYRATSCKKGYKVVSGKCVPKECDEILTDYIKDNGIKDYVLYETGKTPSAEKVIIAKDTGYGAEWKNFYNKKVISAMVYANTIYGSDSLTKLVKQQCTKTPRIEIRGEMNSTSPLDFTSVFLKSSSWWNKGGFTCTNCSLDIFMLYNESKAELKYDARLPNADNVYAKLTGAEIKNQFVSTGYSYELGSLGTKIRNSARRSGGTSVDQGNDSLFRFQHEIIIQGTPSKRISVKTLSPSYYLSVIGGMMFNYADVYIGKTYIGFSSNYTSDSAYYHRSAINIYNTNWYMFERDKWQSNDVYLSTGSFLGVPQSGGRYSSSTGSKIIMANDKIYQALGLRIARRNSEDDGDCWNRVYYFNSNGSISTYLADNRGYKNPICVGLGHHDTSTSAVVRCHGSANGTRTTYCDHVSGRLIGDKHGCQVCTNED